MWDYEKISVKIDLGQIKEFHEKNWIFKQVQESEQVLKQVQ